MGGPKDLLEIKKEVREVLAFRNRGIATTGTDDPSKLVTAKAGTKVPKGEDANVFMIRLFMERDYNTAVERADLISLRDQMRNNADLVAIIRNPRVSLEPDMKRRLVAGWNATITHGDYAGRVHLATSSEPYDTVEEALLERALFRQWRDRTKGCLKTAADWRSWQDHLAASKARGRGKGKGRAGGVHVTADGSAGVAKRQFLRALVRSDWGLSMAGRSFEQIAAELTACGYETTPSQLKNASRDKNPPQEGCCADTPEVRKFLAAIAPGFPGFQSDRLFPAGGQPAARGALTDGNAGGRSQQEERDAGAA